MDNKPFAIDQAATLYGFGLGLTISRLGNESRMLAASSARITTLATASHAFLAGNIFDLKNV